MIMRITKCVWKECIVAVSSLLAFTACGPVNRFTRIKHVPREYAMNYCGTNIKASKAVWLDNAPWIVFSDRSDNFSYRKPTGKNEYKELNFMEPYLVIKEKGDWLKVIRYSPDIVKDGKLQNRKQAQYYGWINKSDLLLTQTSVTDLSTGLKNKQIIVVADSTIMTAPDRYFKNDSVRMFQDLDFVQDYGTAALHSIVYPLKESEDKSRTLVAKKSYISPDSISSEVLGWIDNALIRNIGQQLHVDMNTLPASLICFKDRYGVDTLSCGKERLQTAEELERIAKTLSYSPVVSFYKSDSLSGFRTGAFLPLIDRRANYILNVNGNPITYARFKEIEEELKHINVLFVLEGDNEVTRQYPGIVNVVQSLQSRFSDSSDGFTYKFGAVLPDGGNGANQFATVPLTANYMELLDSLTDKVNAMGKLRNKESGHDWKSLRQAVNMLEGQRRQTNIIILIGETGSGGEWADTTLTGKLADYNCRLLGFQLYGGRPDRFTNFVLQVENMIDSYAKRISISKREKIVYADQLRKVNEYSEVGRNIYCLDFPNRSMTQGWVVFPSKDESLPFDGLAASVDSLLQQVQADNRLLAASLHKAFSETGNFRNRLDSTFVYFHGMTDLSVEPMIHALKTVSPQYFIPAQPVLIPDSLSPYIDYRLLLSESEYKSLRRFVSELANFNIDYKYKGSQSKSKKPKLCGCPDDIWLLDNESVVEKQDSVDNNEYASTGKVRRGLRRLYYAYINSGKLCRHKKKQMKKYSLADAHCLITTCPTDNPFLESFKIVELKRKKYVSDEMLDMLIEYFKEKKEKLEQAAGQTFKSNGQTYYWINQNMLP